MRTPQLKRARRTGFTLVELLTVIAIIALLISLVTPALSRARVQAQRTAVRATLQSIETGCEMFKNDNNDYPKSNVGWFGDGSAQEQTNWEIAGGQGPLWGANLIVDAMVGRDLQGYDPKEGNGAGSNSQSRWYLGSDSTRNRNAPYVSPDKIQTSDNDKKRPKDGFGEYVLDEVTPTIDNLRVPVFVDKFDFPILYYRANPVSGPQTPIIQDSGQSPLGSMDGQHKSRGVYDGRDNEKFTRHAAGTLPSQMHVIADAGDGITYSSTGADPGSGYTNQFVQYIRSIRASSKDPANPNNFTFSRPVNADKFILVSPGPDGRWGTLDDVANFDVLSESR